MKQNNALVETTTPLSLAGTEMSLKERQVDRSPTTNESKTILFARRNTASMQRDKLNSRSMKRCWDLNSMRICAEDRLSFSCRRTQRSESWKCKS